MARISDDAKRNRDDWTQANAEYTDASATEGWAAEEITWGVFHTPEGGLRTLGEVAGLDVVELGCVVDLVELYPPDDAVDHPYYDAFSVEWSRQWPSEEIWVAEKSG